jgi:hypothetical protein
MGLYSVSYIDSTNSLVRAMAAAIVQSIRAAIGCLILLVAGQSSGGDSLTFGLDHVESDANRFFGCTGGGGATFF